MKPGFEADLDSLIQDTIRLTTSVKVLVHILFLYREKRSRKKKKMIDTDFILFLQETCSESCEKSEPKLQRKKLLLVL